MWATELSLEALPSFGASSIVSLVLSHEVEGGSVHARWRREVFRDSGLVHSPQESGLVFNS